MTTAIYPFSGDPITYGHIDIIERGAKIFSRVIVAFGLNPSKKYLFSLDQKIWMAKKALAHIDNVEVVSFSGLLVDFAYEQGASCTFKGLRDGVDFDYEVELHYIGESQGLEIETVLIPAKQDKTHLSSSNVKALQKEQGLIHSYVPLHVKQSLEHSISNQLIVGVTGNSGSGKSTLCRRIGTYSNYFETHHIDVDVLVHQIYDPKQTPQTVFQEVRQTIQQELKVGLDSNGCISREELRKKVFSDKGAREYLANRLKKPLDLLIRRAMRGKSGLFLLDVAYLIQFGMTHYCNHNVIILETDKATATERLCDRDGLDTEDVESRLSAQPTASSLVEKLREVQDSSGWGKTLLITQEEAKKMDSTALKLKVRDFFKIEGNW